MLDFFSLSSSSGHLVDRPSAFHCSIRKELFPLQSKGWDVSMASSRVDVLEGAGAGGGLSHTEHSHSCRLLISSTSSRECPDFTRHDLWNELLHEKHSTGVMLLAIVRLQSLHVFFSVRTDAVCTSFVTSRPAMVT